MIRNDQVYALAGQSNLVSKAINLAINTPVLWAVMKVGARNAMINTAEKSGIPWLQTTVELQQIQEVTLDM